MNTNVFVFDFDGVLIDSVDECAVTSYNLFTDKLISSLDQLPSGYLDLYRANRCRVRHSGDTALLGKWCLSNYEKSSTRIMSKEEAIGFFDQFPDNVNTYGPKFFERRMLLAESSPEPWLRLNSPYQPLWQTLQSLPNFELIIVTYKNKEAVSRLVEFWGIPIESENIYSGDNGARKEEHIVSIQKRFNPRKLFFLDDALKNLIGLRAVAPKSLAFVPILASWGYLAPEHFEQARAEGIEVLDQDDFVALLKRELNS